MVKIFLPSISSDDIFYKHDVPIYFRFSVQLIFTFYKHFIKYSWVYVPNDFFLHPIVSCPLLHRHDGNFISETQQIFYFIFFFLFADMSDL